jgi:hypothetical protein
MIPGFVSGLGVIKYRLILYSPCGVKREEFLKILKTVATFMAVTPIRKVPLRKPGLS